MPKAPAAQRPSCSMESIGVASIYVCTDHGHIYTYDDRMIWSYESTPYVFTVSALPLLTETYSITPSIINRMQVSLAILFCTWPLPEALLHSPHCS